MKHQGEMRKYILHKTAPDTIIGARKLLPSIETNVVFYPQNSKKPTIPCATVSERVGICLQVKVLNINLL